VEAQFPTIIYEAFQNAIYRVNLLQVVTIFCFKCTVWYKSPAGDHRMSQLFCQCYALSVRPVVRTHRPRPPIHARTSRPRPNSIRAQRLNSFARRVWLMPKLFVPMPVPACTHSSSGSRPARFHGQPPQTANRHVGGQQ
jgi:hypothetical protein